MWDVYGLSLLCTSVRGAKDEYCERDWATSLYVRLTSWYSWECQDRRRYPRPVVTHTGKDAIEPVQDALLDSGHHESD